MLLAVFAVGIISILIVTALSMIALKTSLMEKSDSLLIGLSNAAYSIKAKDYTFVFLLSNFVYPWIQTRVYKIVWIK